MYQQQKVNIPISNGGVTVKVIKGTGYVYYTTGRVYSSEEGRSNPIRVTIGKRCEDDPTKMIPNEKYGIYFADRMDDMKGKFEAEIEKNARLVEKKQIEWKEILELLKTTSRSFDEIKAFLKGEEPEEE